jgi:hypothetical protein
MTTTNKTAADSKLDKIMANAKANRREARKIDLMALSAEEEDRLKSENMTEGQMEMLDKLGVEYDPRPLSEGGTLSRWNAMSLVDEALRAAKGRREKARAEPATVKQIEALLKFGCNVDDIESLTAGEASDLIRRFTQEIEARRRSQNAGRK